jgi:hypothetical protein
MWQVEDGGGIPPTAILVERFDGVSWNNGAASAPTFCVPSP